MVANAVVTDVIKSLNDLQERCGLRQTNDDRVFSEWTGDLLPLHQQAQVRIDRMKQRYDSVRELDQNDTTFHGRVVYHLLVCKCLLRDD